VSCTGTSTADPAVDADAPPAIANSPATPNAGVALFTLFRFGLFVARAIGILHTLGSRPFTKRIRPSVTVQKGLVLFPSAKIKFHDRIVNFGNSLQHR
jgi:hypothetical protein